jgi:hypothetical protein
LVATVASPNGKQRLLGEFGGPAIVTAPPCDPQYFVRVEETVTLALPNLQPHTLATVSFDLNILKSWDGNDPNYGPDRWSLSVQGGPTLLDTTFSNNPKTDTYDLSQQNYPIVKSPDQTGAAAMNTSRVYVLWGRYLSSDPSPSRTPATPSRSTFSSSMFEGKGTDDESWGLDNVRISTNADKPQAASAAVPDAGLAPQGLGSVYGLNLAPEVEAAADQPWPTALAGVTLTVHDSGGATLAAPLLYVSPNRIDFQVPADTVVGPVTFTVQTPTEMIPDLPADVRATAPAIFTANRASGRIA